MQIEMNQQKAITRKEMLDKRTLITPFEAKMAGGAVIDVLVSFLSTHSFSKEKRGITLFAPIRGEIDLLSEAYKLEQLGFYICLPRIMQDKMRFFRYQSGELLIRSSFGVPEPSDDAADVEPSQIAVAVCPGRAFDQKGNRLGYGKGYYDRYFGLYKDEERPILIGAAYPLQVLAQVPQTETDIRMNYLILPGDLMTCQEMI